ncbi:glycoside hydrolase family 16 protein [Hymenobacter sp. BRD128]|uniref:glycoside hydrolase family 16 protein n=1 Tax=Hymenobacter sp. BRD128 TaxID=2675878 RepID=UPI00156667C1|nr:glycoside hydrolase family 16 protein [Hymenobacter sp. BRD128]QKG55797.1 glycoside hydrolase family 16 protein [Hymenobacter sp. BRD128]
MLLIPHPFRLSPAGAGLSLALLLGTSCTENKTPVIPAPVAPPTVVNADTRDYAQYTELMWSDEFNGSGPVDATKWMYDTGGGGWGNQELETYTTSTNNVFQNSGNLIIQANKEPSGSPAYTSGRVLTKGKQNFQYGRIDVRAKLPQGQGVWPAIWMLGSDIDQNNWPKCGEIDIMELRGQNPTEILTTMHYADNSGNHQQSGIDHIKLPDGSSFANDFHTYSVVRSKDQIRFYLDGALYYSFTSGTVGSNPYPFNNNFFVVLNVAVGGNFLGNPNGSTVFPQQMQVDYVRYYQYK